MALISAQNLGNSIATFLEQELIPKSNGIQKVITYIAIATVQNKTPQMVTQYASTLKVIDAINDSGDIELEVLFNTIKDALHKTGTITMAGINFNEDDLLKIYNIASTFAK